MDKPKRIRIDKLLVDHGYFESRERAQRSILAGQVLVEEIVVDKPGTLVRSNAAVRVIAEEKYVGRGGYKLEAALDHFGINPIGLVCLDVGASTGGFTDCLLQRGAGRVIAIDVGHNQLAWKIRADERVDAREGVNARNLSPELIGTQVQLATVDVSFISLTLILPPMFSCVQEGGAVIALIKPQFELEPGLVGKGGIVRDEQARLRSVSKIRDCVVGQLDREWIGVIDSPITGAKGNREFLACLR
ncbi:MAG TPA: TlyA family RNA methyltransferase [Chthoniobacterales bacterium]|nr:TlyA family RNA methyltransferase [Chthoniobacterales bacterium]